MRARRGGAGLTAVMLATGLLTAVTSPAGAAAAPKATSPAARQAPFVALAHKALLKAPVKAKAVASFRLTGVAGVPTTASAVVLSVTVPTPITSGTLTFYPYGAKRPSVVSLAYATGRTATTTLVVTPGSNGKASLYNAAAKGDNVVVTVDRLLRRPRQPQARPTPRRSSCRCRPSASPRCWSARARPRCWPPASPRPGSVAWCSR